MTIYVVVKEGKDEKTYAVAAFTNLKLAMKFAKNQNKISDEKHTVISTLLLDTMY